MARETNISEDQEDIPHVVFVGGGASAHINLSLLYSAIYEGAISLPLKVTIIEKGDELGKGMPYNSGTEPFHMMLGYHPDDHGTVQWLNTPEGAPFAHLRDNARHKALPRLVHGHHAAFEIKKTIESIKKAGVDLEIISNIEVTEVKDEGLDYKVICGDKTLTANHVVLATGHWDKMRRENSLPGILHSPWPAQQLKEEVPTNYHSAIIGTGLSAVDAALTLAHREGEFKPIAGQNVGVEYIANKDSPDFKITMYSHNGWLPGTLSQHTGVVFATDDLVSYLLHDVMHGRKKHVPLDRVFHATRDLFLQYHQYTTGTSKDITGRNELSTVIDFLRHPKATLQSAVTELRKYLDNTPAQERLEKEISQAAQSIDYNQPVIWQVFLIQMMKVLDDVYPFLSAEDEKFFTENIKPIVTRYSAGMVLDNAEKIHALMRDGRLEVKRLGHEYAIASNPTVLYQHGADYGGGTIYYNDAHDKKCEVQHKRIIKAANGKNMPVETSSALMKQLFKDGVLQSVKVPYADLANMSEKEKKDAIDINGIPHHNIGGVFVNLQTYEVIPAHFNTALSDSESLAQMSLQYRDPDKSMYAIGPLLTSQIPIFQGFQRLREQSIVIWTDIAERIMQKRQMTYTPPPNEDLFFLIDGAYVGGVITSAPRGIPDEILAEMIANHIGAHPANIEIVRDAERIRQLRESEGRSIN